MDMLSRLGARAMGTPSTVKPVIAPLFLARAPVAGPTEVEAGFEHEQDDQTSGAVEQGTAARVRPRLKGPEAADETPADEETHLPPPVATESVLERRQPSGRDIERPPTIDSARSARDPIPSPGRQRTSIPRRAQARPRSAHFARDPDQRLHAAGEPMRHADAPRPGAQDESASVAARTPGSASAPRAPLRTNNPDVASALERLRALRETVTAVRMRRDPVVRVSIGRVEVRSTQASPAEPVAAPPAPPAVRTAPPRVTLADYLARRREAR